MTNTTQAQITMVTKAIRDVSRVLILTMIAGAIVFAGSGVLMFLLIPVLTYTIWVGFWIGCMLIQMRRQKKNAETEFNQGQTV